MYEIDASMVAITFTISDGVHDMLHTSSLIQISASSFVDIPFNDAYVFRYMQNVHQY